MTTDSPVPTPLDQRLRRARVAMLPGLVWLLGAFLAARLWLAGPRSATYYGLATGTETRVTCPEDARLERVLVSLYESVDAGEILAVLDDSGLRARIETERAVLEQVAATLRAERSRLENGEARERHAEAMRSAAMLTTLSLEYPAELRAFFADETALELRELEVRLERSLSALERARLEVALARAEAMVEGHIGARAEVEDLRLRVALEEERAASLDSIETGVRSAIAAARKRRETLGREFDPSAFTPLAEFDLEEQLEGWKLEIEVQEQRLAELNQLRGRYVLRAPQAGRVAALVASEGQFLLAGEGVLVLMEAEAREVALWVPEHSSESPTVGDRLLLTNRVDRTTEIVAECFVQALSPRLERMPERLWRDARVVEYGRAARVGPAAALALVPGQRVRIDPVR